MQMIFSQDGYSLYKYSPTLLKPFYVNMEKLYFMRRIRFFVEWFTGFRVYYLLKDNEYIGYCVVSNGGTYRYPFSTKNDIIVGPYYIDQSYRGQRLSIYMLNTVLNISETNYEIAYDYIEKTNKASISTSQAVGFKLMSEVNVARFSRRLISAKSGCGKYYVMTKLKRNDFS